MSNDLIDSNIHFKEALDLSEPTLYHKAVVKFSKALQESPKDRHIIYNDWGNALSNQFKYKAALSKYKISVKISPSFTFAHNGWGTALLNLGHFDGATRRFQKAHELEPNGFLFTANWSLGLYLSGNEAKAVEILQEGMKSIDPNSIWNPINLKIVFQNQIEILEVREERACKEEEKKLIQKGILGIKWIVEIFSAYITKKISEMTSTEN